MLAYLMQNYLQHVMDDASKYNLILVMYKGWTTKLNGISDFLSLTIPAVLVIHPFISAAAGEKAVCFQEVCCLQR